MYRITIKQYVFENEQMTITKTNLTDNFKNNHFNAKATG